MSSDMVTAEYYRDPMQINLVGAVDVPAKRMNEAAQIIGKTICRVLHLDTLDTVFIGCGGEKIDHIVVHR